MLFKQIEVTTHSEIHIKLKKNDVIRANNIDDDLRVLSNLDGLLFVTPTYNKKLVKDDIKLFFINEYHKLWIPNNIFPKNIVSNGESLGYKGIKTVTGIKRVGLEVGDYVREFIIGSAKFKVISIIDDEVVLQDVDLNYITKTQKNINKSFTIVV